MMPFTVFLAYGAASERLTRKEFADAILAANLGTNGTKQNLDPLLNSLQA